MAHEVSVPLRWGDMDAQGHLNNCAYVDYLQEARVDWLLRGPHTSMLGSGILVAAHQIEFRRPVVFDAEPLRIALRVESAGASRMILAYHLTHSGEPVGRARTILAPVDLTTGRPRRLAPDERDWLRAQTEPGEPFRELPSGPGDADRALAVPVPVRWGDLDAYGHVNNARFFDYAQEARIQLVHRGLGPQTEDSGGWVVVRQDMDYLAQLNHRLEPYPGTISVLATGRTSLTLLWEVADETAAPFARARTVLVRTGPDGRPAEIDQRLLSALQPAPAGSAAGSDSPSAD